MCHLHGDGRVCDMLQSLGCISVNSFAYWLVSVDLAKIDALDGRSSRLLKLPSVHARDEIPFFQTSGCRQSLAHLFQDAIISSVVVSTSVVMGRWNNGSAVTFTASGVLGKSHGGSKGVLTPFSMAELSRDFSLARMLLHPAVYRIGRSLLVHLGRGYSSRGCTWNDSARESWSKYAASCSWTQWRVTIGAHAA